MCRCCWLAMVSFSSDDHLQNLEELSQQTSVILPDRMSCISNDLTSTCQESDIDLDLGLFHQPESPQGPPPQRISPEGGSAAHKAPPSLDVPVTP